MVSVAMMPRHRLLAMREAAREVERCRRALSKGGCTVVSEVLRGQHVIDDWAHYPQGDVVDEEFNAQYYYHRHSESERPAGEQGHFHTFIRSAGGHGAPVHLVGLAMDRMSVPVRLFTTNVWVTGEAWHGADELIDLLGRFAVDHARPSWPLNLWLTAMLRLFQPAIEDLLRQRDAVMRGWAAAHAHVENDRRLETVSELCIDVDSHIGEIDAALARTERGIQ
jgi:hypothetical protein